MQTVDGNRLDGCIFGDTSPKDYRLEFGDKELPKKVDLRRHCTPVEDQGRIGSCTANACVGALEYAYTKRDGRAPDLSRLFVYFNTRRLKGTINQDTGAGINEAMAAVMAFGACEASYWPYDTNNFSMEPPQQAYMNGKLHEPIQYARVPGPAGAMHALANGYPVVYGTFLPQRCYDVAAQTGRVPATTPQERTGRPAGGHCMLIVGYDSDEKIFTVRNSWGQQWGNGGYCEIPFDEMVFFSPPETFWMMLELEPSASFSVVRPETDSTQSLSATSGLGVTASGLRESIGASLRAELGQASSDIKARTAQFRESLNAPRASKAGGFSSGQCTMCRGSGTCWYCNGTGSNMGYPCDSCSRSARCYVCSGTGQA